MKRIFLPAVIASIVFLAVPINTQAAEVVVYTALDQIYSEPLLNQFEKTTGIRVLPVYDTEANKTVGLVNRLMAEKARPRCDVFWNNEIARTLVLKKENVLAPYKSPKADDIPTRYRDPENYWTGFAARARILIVNTELVPENETPTSMDDLIDLKWKGKAVIANPLFGTTSTHTAALFAEIGPAKAKDYFHALKENEVTIAAGNAMVRDMVARGERHFGWTDTDDANGAIEDGRPVKIVVPDQKEGQIGVLIIPNTVSLVRGAPNPEEGKALIDFLLTRETEKYLAHCRSAQIPVRKGIPIPENVLKIERLEVMDVNYSEIAETLPASTEFIHDKFVR